MVDVDNLVPIVFGVTGHRDLIEEDMEPLKKVIMDKFMEVTETYPNTPITLLTPLAEGADRLVAKSALEFKKLNPDKMIDIVVPISMPVEEYKKDFQSEESVREFEELLSCAKDYFELGFVEGNNEENIREYGVNRDRQYEQVGVYVAKRSQILIALWDGVYKEAVGGTSQIVKFKRLGEPEPYIKDEINPLEPVERWPVYHIFTPRKSNPEVNEIKYEAKYIYPTKPDFDEETQKKYEESIKEKYEIMLLNIEKFNRDIRNIIPNYQDEFEKNKGYVINGEDIDLLSQDEKKLLNYYTTADTLANFFRAKRENALKTITFIVLAAAILFVIYKKLGNVSILILYLGTIMGGLGLYKFFETRDYQNKHQDYRALAEGLRVQLFWNISGINKDAAKYYMRKHMSELEWIRNVIRICSISRPDSLTLEIPKVKLAVRQWIEDQKKYYFKKIPEYQNRIKNSGKIARCISYSVLGLVFVVLLSYLLPDSTIKNEVKSWGILLTALLPPFSAAISNYITKMSLKEITMQYRRMGETFEIAHSLLNKYIMEENSDKIKEIMFYSGIEALNENGDWVLTNRYKPMDKPMK